MLVENHCYLIFHIYSPIFFIILCNNTNCVQSSICYLHFSAQFDWEMMELSKNYQNVFIIFYKLCTTLFAS